MSTLLTSVGTVLTSAVGWMSTIVNAITDTPILLISVALGFAFVGIRLFKSLRHS